MTDLPAIPARRRTGTEPITDRGQPLGPTVADFWAWSASDLLANTARGVLAEFLVAVALGITGGRHGIEEGVRPDWVAWDVTTAEGVKVEVKCSGYIQTWEQTRLSAIAFSVRAARGWDPDTNLTDVEPQRHADVYVFALHAEQHQEHVDPLELTQWEFYVLPTCRLDERGQRSITLAALRTLTAALSWSQLRTAVDAAAAEQRDHLSAGSA